ncbi:hypothetical protein B0H14DRAFT_3464485 [Mycena olivaceomarginata]|nr:hypothetical protein B0H14DRAFT_3464485 [Mycena olivaceomarginata]
MHTSPLSVHAAAGEMVRRRRRRERQRARSDVCAFGQAAAPPHLTTESVGEWAGDGRQSQAKSKKEARGGRRGHARSSDILISTSLHSTAGIVVLSMCILTTARCLTRTVETSTAGQQLDWISLRGAAGHMKSAGEQ